MTSYPSSSSSSSRRRPSHHEWHLLSPVGAGPSPRNGHTSVVDPDINTIYLFGGYDGKVHYNDLYALSLLPSAPAPHSSRKDNRKNYSNGGMWFMLGNKSSSSSAASSSTSSSISSFSSSSSSSDALSLSLPTARSLHSAVIYQGSMYVYGGVGQKETRSLWGGRSVSQEIYGSIERFNLRTQEWSVVTSSTNNNNNNNNNNNCPPARDGHSAVVYGDCMYIYGGSNDVEVFDDIWRFSFATSSWTRLPISLIGDPLPPKHLQRRLHTACMVGSIMYVVGGYQGQNCFNDVLKCNVITGSLEVVPCGEEGPRRGYGHSATLLKNNNDANNNKIVVFGGYGDGTGYRSNLYLFSTKTNSWTQVMRAPLPSSSSSLPSLEDNDVLVSPPTDDNMAPQQQLLEAWPEYRRRHTAVMIYNDNDNKNNNNGTMIILGGVGHQYFNDVWKFVLRDDAGDDDDDDSLLNSDGLLRHDMARLLDNASEYHADASIITRAETGVAVGGEGGGGGEKKEEEVIYVHKAILSARCEHFKYLFNSSMKEAQDGVVSLDDIPSSVVHALLRYLYTGQDDVVLPDVAADLLCLSDRFMLPRLKRVCEGVLIEGIDHNNAASLLMIADTYSCPKLKKEAIEYCAKNHRQVLSQDGFKSLPPHILLEVMSAVSKSS